jgi:integrase
MSLRKRCSGAIDGSDPLFCSSSPKCEHHWHYDFRVNGRRHRASTETADKHRARDIEAKERARILEGRHGIRRQPDTTFREFASIYLRDYARLNKRSADRDEEIIKVLNRAFGDVLLHEITGHRIEQFKRERSGGKWRGYKYTGPAKAIRPGTVNRELDTLRSIFSKAVEWRRLNEHPMGAVRRIKVDNRRTRILTEAQQLALLAECSPKLRRFVRLALITGARPGELLALRWEDVGEDELTFVETKNGRSRRLPLSSAIRAVLKECPQKGQVFVFQNSRTQDAYTVNGLAHTFRRALERAGVDDGDVTLHTLRHTALSRMISMGIDMFTVMAISGHSSTRMLERYVHPTDTRKLDALSLGGHNMVTKEEASGEADSETDQMLKHFGGRHEARTRDLRVANASGSPPQPLQSKGSPTRKRGGL